ncbi:hypothetical protein HPB48_005032 [Haemaphysalis longicornis]|uniref:Reverse transcriptase n=1 Tax=Haemaphysalis longicornis TaxID=44386 RepID=A0A9J6GER3_HAELO|nr:hypothetical protein HPB48_005032 [Haemaphysalis longicornis]
MECHYQPLCNLKDTTMTRAKVRERVSQVETQQWADRAAAKPVLHFYVAHKREIRCEGFYDNASGSGLLFEARSGTLRTRRWQVSCGTAESAICELCGEEEESIEHVVLSCPRLEPKQPSGVSLEQALGFRQTGPSGGAAVTSDGRDRGAVTAIIDRTKRRLERMAGDRYALDPEMHALRCAARACQGHALKPLKNNAGQRGWMGRTGRRGNGGKTQARLQQSGAV